MYEITRQRLYNQQIAATQFKTLAELVGWLGAMQAQEYGQSKWAVGVRLPGCTDAMVEQALADRSILRSWVMRGTLHTVAAADIHWMLDLLAPRLLTATVGRKKQLGLEQPMLHRSLQLLESGLEGREMTRDQLISYFAQSGFDFTSHHIYHIMHHAALEQVVCVGVRVGNEPTFTLLSDRVPAPVRMTREEALATLAARYFNSRGPASLQDFIWWSGLTVKEAQKGFESVKNDLDELIYEGQSFWGPKDQFMEKTPAKRLFLLPGFDEYILGYRDRSLFLKPGDTSIVVHSNGIFNPMIVLDGQVVGVWKKTIKKNAVLLEPNTFVALDGEARFFLEEERLRYEAFLLNV
ncbi:MAG: winged helix DNA-binding domain-containing protein [Bacteroidota bacterium]